MSVFFISDLHLKASRPEITHRFLHFLQTKAREAEALYILGDFFEAWIGDDDQNPHDERIIQALAEFSGTGIPLYFMSGNRDFLVGQQFARRVRGTLLPDPSLVEIYNKKILLMHGDLLCTQDLAYQRFRKFVRNVFIQKLFLWLPLWVRRKIALKLRTMSETSKRENARNKADIFSQEKLKHQAAGETVQEYLERFQAEILIHGHTHQPLMEDINIRGKTKKRVVLGEWHRKTGSLLVLSPEGLKLEVI